MFSSGWWGLVWLVHCWCLSSWLVIAEFVTMLLCLLLVVLPSPPSSSSLSGMLFLVLLLLLFLFWLLGVIMLFILISILDIDQATSSLKESAVTSGHGMTRQIDQEKGLAMKKWHEMTYVTPIDIINNCWRASLINPTSSFCQKKKSFPAEFVQRFTTTCGKTVCNMQGATVNKHYMESGWIKRADLHRGCHQVGF